MPIHPQLETEIRIWFQTPSDYKKSRLFFFAMAGHHVIVSFPAIAIRKTGKPWPCQMPVFEPGQEVYAFLSFGVNICMVYFDT
jgi:hypothetical protein